MKLVLGVEEGEDKRAGNVQKQHANVLSGEMTQVNYVNDNQDNSVQ